MIISSLVNDLPGTKEYFELYSISSELDVGNVQLDDFDNLRKWVSLLDSPKSSRDSADFWRQGTARGRREASNREFML